MILLETSILAFAFGQRSYPRNEPKAVEDLRKLIADDWPLAIPGVVLQELLAGVREEEKSRRLQRAIESFPIVTATRQTHVHAARIAVACHLASVRCSTVESLIAALATESASLLFTLDRNFSKIAPQCGLRLYKAGMMARMHKPS